MTKENLITVPVGTTLEEAEKILHRHRVEKLLVVDDQYYSEGPDHGQRHSEETEVSQCRQGRTRAVAGGAAHRSDRQFSGAGARTGGRKQLDVIADRYGAWPQRARYGRGPRHQKHSYRRWI